LRRAASVTRGPTLVRQQPSAHPQPMYQAKLSTELQRKGNCAP
jgi:hypothetical protein